MIIDPWFSVMVDQRGSVFIPVPVKKYLGIGPGFGLVGRLLGSALVFIPFSTAAQWPQDTRQRDFNLSKLLNDAWNGAAPPVSPPLFGSTVLAAPVEEAPKPVFEEDDTGEAKQVIRELVYVNQKGFLTFPPAIKDLLGLTIGMPFMLEIRMRGADPVLVVEPVTKTGAINEHMERKRQEHLEEDRLRRSVQALEERIAKLKEEKTNLEQEVRAKKEATAGTSVFAQLLQANDHKPVNPLMDPTKMPITPPDEGNKWHFSDMGWVQTADVNED